MRSIKDGSRAIDDNNLKAFPARLTWQADQKNRFTAMFDWANKVRGHRNLSPTINVDAAVQQGQPAEHILQGKWTSTVTNHLLFETGYSQTFNAPLYSYQPQVVIGTCHTAYNLCAPGTGYGSIPHNDTVLGTQYVATLEQLASGNGALDDALAQGVLTVGELQGRYLDFAGSRRAGIGRMRALIDERSEEAFVPPESVLEGMLYAVLDQPGMPRYQRQAPLPWAPDRRADAALIDAPVLLEADGRPWHTRVADFERDRRRDRVAASHGHATLRFTHTDLTRPAEVTAAEILAVFRSYAPPIQRLAG